MNDVIVAVLIQLIGAHTWHNVKSNTCASKAAGSLPASRASGLVIPLEPGSDHHAGGW